MGQVDINGSGLGNALSELLTAPDIVPGDQPSYETCKALWLYHPLGKKMVEGPITMAQSQARTISVPDSPEMERVRDQFVKQWETDGCDEVVHNVVAVSRAYGIGSLATVCEDVPPSEPIDPKQYADLKIAFSVFDPLNTAGSLVLNQDPGSIDFMKVTAIAVSGKAYHRSRTVTLMHERPVYIAYTTSAYGFVGRSVFQRALYPLKSFIQTMITDDLVTKKAGVFIAMLKTAGAIIDAIMSASAGLKRLFVKDATVVNGNVISIGTDEKIETLNMQNIDGAYGNSRKNILENIATAADMPAIILKQETFAEGFGEGTEDAKLVAGFVDAFRRHIRPVYAFLDPIIMRRAWTPEFYKTIQNDFPEYADLRYEDAFYKWSNSFAAEWPNLLTEPDSEKVKTADVKLKAIIAVWEVLAPALDPENKAIVAGWLEANINSDKLMFQNPLQLNLQALEEYVPPQQQALEEPKEPKPFAANDSQEQRRVARKAARRQIDAEPDLLAPLAGHTPKPNGHLNGKTLNA
jgi:hypothetical protein